MRPPNDPRQESSLDAGAACAFGEDVLPFVLGDLSEVDEARFREHLLEGCGTCGAELRDTRADVAHLDLAIAERAERTLRRDAFETTRAALGLRLKARIETRAQAGASAGDVESVEDASARPPASPAAEPPVPCPPRDEVAPGVELAAFDRNVWIDTPFPGIRMRVLHADSATRRWTCLVELAAGAVYPSHRHAGAEECLVLSGDVTMGGRRMERGDYQLSHEDSTHTVVSSEDGCEMLLIASWENELILDTLS